MIDGKNDKGGSEGTLFVGAGVTLRGDVEVPGSASSTVASKARSRPRR
jgi:hypothetical protein